MEKTTKTAILEQATALFYEFGYPNTSIRDIAQSLNINNPSIYYYFNSKENLLFEIIEFIGLEVVKELEEVVATVNDPVTRLATMVSRHIHLNIQERKKIKVFIEEGYHLSGKFKDRILFLNRKIYHNYYYQLKIMGEQNLLTSDKYSIMAFTILGAINWAYRWFKEDGSSSKEEVAKTITHSIFSGIIKAEILHGVPMIS